MWSLSFLVGSLTITIVLGLMHEDVGPWVNATKGEILPRVYRRVGHVKPYKYFAVNTTSFKIRTVGFTCDIIENAIERYANIINTEASIARKSALPSQNSFGDQDPNSRPQIDELQILLRHKCEYFPYLGMNENYTLLVAGKDLTILEADAVWGVLRGLETFSQLLTSADDGSLKVEYQLIEDNPRFPHRGLLLDTSRHFLPVSDILLTLDAMSFNKLNVFHWHIVDDNSFPYVSTTFPELSRGAYHPSMVYRPEDVSTIIEYGRLRGIRIIPEFDAPAHTKSWGLYRPELLTQCYEQGEPNGKFGPMNPTVEEVYIFLEALYNEIFQKFPDRYVHLGGDEIGFDCWASNPNITAYMREHGYKDGDFKALEAKFFERLLPIPKAANATSIVWQEVFSNVDDLPSDAVVQIWTGLWRSLIIDVVNKNHPAILSACWYLDSIKSGGDWIKYYLCDPTDFDGTPEMKSLVLGGEACMWGEFVDKTNVHQRIWPRASAAAERLWSHDAEPITEVAKRMEEHACRMNRRGIPAQPPNGSGFCVS